MGTGRHRVLFVQTSPLQVFPVCLRGSEKSNLGLLRALVGRGWEAHLLGFTWEWPGWPAPLGEAPAEATATPGEWAYEVGGVQHRLLRLLRSTASRTTGR